VSTTTSTYLAVSQNLARYQSMTAEQPDVTAATAYYKANIGSVKSASDLVNNYRLARIMDISSQKSNYLSG
jgi:hypothetical protein